MALVTVEVGEARKGEGAPRRRAAQRDGAIERPIDSKATTLPEFFEECVKRHGDRKAMGWRDLKEVHVETKKVTKIVDGEETKVDKDWEYFEMSSYRYQTYPEVLDLVKQYGRGLVNIGIKPNQENKLHIFASTSHKWMKTYLATQTQNIPIVTAYDTLGEQGLTHSLVLTESNAIFTDNNLLSALINPLKKAENVKTIIHAEKIDPEDKRAGGKFYREAKEAKEKIQEIRPDIKFVSYDEVIEAGKEKPSEKFQYTAKPEDVSCIMFTSGSTGDPKGVLLTHANIVAGVSGPSTCAGRDLVSNNDRVIAFLPLAHIFELVFEVLTFWWGGCLGYANVKTLTDTSVKNCNSDLQEFKPTIMVAVAAVWETVRKGILAKVKALPTVTQKIFWASYKAKTVFTNNKIPGGSIFDIVFKKVRAATGGHLHHVLNGGSPVSRDTQVFISTLIAPMLVGYGLTETCANSSILEHNRFEYGSAGTIVGSVTAKLIDVPEAGYFAKDNQGEVLLKGAPICSEYYKNPKETKEAFTEDGWFKTGDIGEWDSNGALKIIDRRKNLVKTANGEYIALEKLESIYRSNAVVLNICVYADQNKVKPIAIVIPNEAALKTHLKDDKVYSDSELQSKELATLCHDKKTISSVHKSLVATGKSQGLKGIELIQNVVLVDDEWTPQNGFVTSAQKLQRRKILAEYKEGVDAAYK
ncbi:hypothetical protein FT663_01537 [Candidozyma haemuli var. vulneris]|uniref:AMP-dependent synthetase/ligase domain-containing protein n=1 Tax=Candidozyma haemuli TaxID=45357 RepID=A0A2V1AS36_9ASCO|nr:hypothetical protein CXQ85_002123 [[Candida] haemuloni]KAF3990692.1 hypothetical protein FT662_02115 [[Candida] haemuloni var. vulneris]KAF3994306.1 hypothetical protein FT663_01537 [[Candida] haemuloni var. vulneris]PVH20336.1 hypothetical protein CXQ85_002123 [[Candida] haemuloni]